MRKTLLFLLCLLLTLGLCACGAESAPMPSAAPSAEPSAAPSTPTPSATPTEEAAQPQRSSSLPGASLHAAEPERAEAPASLVEDAQRFVDGPVEALIAALGEPLSRDYAPSCLGSGKDGELRYEGFTVYTYLSDEGETVTGVE